MTDLSADIRYIKGIGEMRAKSLKKLGIEHLWDLICYFPRTYEDRREVQDISRLRPDETATVKALVTVPPRLAHIRRGLDLVKLKVSDDTGSMNVTFFNQGYIKNSLAEGAGYYFYGKISGSSSRPEMTNPVFERETEAGITTRRIVPIYRLTTGVSQKVIINSVMQGLDACKDIFPDPLPDTVRSKYHLAQADFAYRNIHFPKDFESLEIARRRLIFEELFVLAASLRLLRERRGFKQGIKMQSRDIAPFYSALPFQPTTAQRRSISEAMEDMTGDTPMNRLVQGDVGSGKTVVGASAAYFAHLNGYQSAFMAPTEILAKQHTITLSRLLQPLGMRVGLLKGSLTAKTKRELRELISQGYYDLVVGTHALISESVDFKNLGLVITDEQHRFGVNQRSALSGKGSDPHVLVMSATPIPRTLALIIYGDLDISVINELPPGRQKIDTFAVGEDMRQRIYSFTKKLIDEGRQAYFVCPSIEENEESISDMKAAKDYAKELETVFPGLNVGIVHGKMKVKDKDKAMAAFVAGEIDILVSTTVIEVGVDVPNAALMVIENAERFGLSQLHQLRGRVGRGGHKSYCVLFSSQQNPETQARLGAMCKTDDGFVIAEEDLKLRGPGDFFGSRQHGLPEMKIADLNYDMDVLKLAQKAAQEVLADDPDLHKPENRRLSQRVEEIYINSSSSLN